MIASHSARIFPATPQRGVKRSLSIRLSGNSMLGKFLLADVAHAVFLFAFFEHVDDVAAAGFFLAVDVTADRLGLLLGFVGNFFGETEIERV